MACTETRREQIADLAAGRLGADAADDVLAHVAVCGDCSDEFDLVADLVRVRPAADTRAARPGLRLWRPVLALAAVLVAALLVRDVWWPDPPSIRELAQVTPIVAPESLLRGDPGDRGPEFARGMAAYAQGAWATAVEQLRITATRRPEDALALLYVGIAEIQAGDPRAAVAPLQAAARHGSGLVAERGLWFLANTHLLLDDREAARAALESLLELDGDYAANAEALLRSLRDR